MKTIFFLACLFLPFFSNAEFQISEPELWKNLHEGNFSLGHKMILSRPIISTNDSIMDGFMLAYLYYKMGRSDEEIITFIEGVDSYVTYHYILEN